MIRTLLIIEDKPGATKALCDFLSHQGYVVLTSSSFTGAFRPAGSAPPDLVIADISKSGHEGVRTARALGMASGVPVMILTDLPSIELGEWLSGDPSVDTVIFKPCSDAAILRALEKTHEAPLHPVA